MVPSSMIDNEVIEVERNPWADNFFRPLLLTIMIMCFNLSLVNLARLINPTWRGTFFLIGMLLTTVEAIYSYRILKHQRMRGTSMLRYRAAEWTVLIVILKILSLADKPLSLVWADLQVMWQNPLNVINYEFYVVIVLAFISWLVATNTMVDFEKLYDPFTFRSERIAPLDGLAVRFFWGGIILVVISGMSYWITKLGLSSLVDFKRPSAGGIIINVLIYFVLGLVLLSQANLARLMMGWRFQKIEVRPGLVRQWAKYGLIFLGLITFVVFFLPTSYSLGFLTSAAIVINYVLSFIFSLIQILFLLISLPLAWLLSLLSNSPEDSAPIIEQPPPSLLESQPEPTPIPWLEALRSLAFWLLTVVIVWYLVKIYLNDHPELLESLKRFKPIRLLVDLLKQLWQWVTGLAQSSFEMVSARIKLPGQKGGNLSSDQGWNWFRWGRLSARERILYYYLNILKRAEKRRLARRIHQTPYEYEPNLGQAVPDVQTEVHELTDVFVRARYSQEGFNETHVAAVKRQWRRIRQELRNLGRSDSAAKKPED
jgi:hypothetical protein